MSELSYESTSEFLATPKGALHFHVAGDGPPLLMLHGSGPGVSGWANFGGNLPAFARDFTTYLLDLPGFGKSYSVYANPLPAAPGAVLDFLDGLGLGPLPIVGNSMGGAVAARIAAQHPERVARLVALGGVAMRGLFGTAEPMKSLRGRWHDFGNIPVMATFHPSYLLRNQALAEKRKVWEDMLQVLERLRVPISQKQQNFFLGKSGSPTNP